MNEDIIGVSFNETTSLIDLDELIEIFADLKGKRCTDTNYLKDNYYEGKKYKELNKDLLRTSEFMKQT